MVVRHTLFNLCNFTPVSRLGRSSAFSFPSPIRVKVGTIRTRNVVGIKSLEGTVHNDGMYTYASFFASLCLVFFYFSFFGGRIYNFDHFSIFCTSTVEYMCIINKRHIVILATYSSQKKKKYLVDVMLQIRRK